MAVGVFSNKIDKEELKPGDHIYSWRLCYLYSHHGIYTGDGKVIHFTRGVGQEIGTGTVLDRYIFSSSPSKSLDTPCPQCGDQSNLDGVISSCLECFLSGGNLYRFEYSVSPFIFLAQVRGGTCTLASSDPPKDVLYRAEYLLENGFGGYDTLKNNCEDFAIYCKTGLNIFEGRSGQAASFVAAGNTVVSLPLRFMTTRFNGLAVAGSGLAVLGSGLAVAGSCAMYSVNRLASDIGVRRNVRKIPVEVLVARSPAPESERVSVSEMAKED